MGCSHPAKAPRNQIAKRSTDNSYVPMALTADRWAAGGKPVELITDAFVTRVHTEERNGKKTATGVTWRAGATGELHREDAKVVVLAGGCTENPRLWLNSGLPNPNDWVGRGYTDHYFDWVFATFDEYTGSSKGTGSSARSDWLGRGGVMNVGIPPALLGFTMTVSDSGIRGEYANGRGPTGPWDGPAGRLLGNELKDLMMHGIDRVFAMLIMTDDHVEAQNRTSLSALPADEHGSIAKVEMHQRKRGRRTVENREFLVRRAVEIARAAGAKKVFRMDWAPIILHVQSSMRMGESEANSVLDADGRARWVDALYIADNSALPNGASGANPTLTMQAVSTRTAEKIFADRFGGDPWVRTEAPVVSTDARITQRLAELGL
ncbi:choline dehydrogenase-like flavoprotein [Amycolatopsis roodepoortensis]|uniref:Choline dehydrogenase-like flavoprotein n=2 Tax=Amycolatopsis roodepoortensis TaxID=700274 RepID=A0ABR9KYL8_9PSEU|nr:choline dehydrogenase-like flavoprotein [Amycolatopsis roodepoortensis]